MKNRILILLILILPGSLMALDVGADFHIGNLDFTSTRTSDIATFDGLSFPWGISIYANQSVSDMLQLNSGFNIDPVLRNNVYTIFTYKQDFLRLGVGPFFGLFNSPSTLLKSGISVSVQLEFPGIVFLYFRTDSSIGGRIVETGDYIQERSDAAAGFYVRNAICSLNLQTKKYTEKTAAGEAVENKTDYFFKTDIYKKNIPYRVIFMFGYESMSKTFLESDIVTIHKLNSIILAAQADIIVTDFLTVITRLDSSIYSFGQEALLGITNPGPGNYLFELSAGFSLNIDRIIEKTKSLANSKNS